MYPSLVDLRDQASKKKERAWKKKEKTQR